MAGLTARIVPPDKEHPLYKLWHTRAIGASAAGAIMGRDRFQTARKLFDYITKRREKDPQTPAMLEGLAMEPWMLERWERIVGKPGESANLIDAEHDFLRAQIDWLSYDGTEAAEFKFTRSVRAFSEVFNFKLPAFWVSQAQHKMMVLGLEQIGWLVATPSIQTLSITGMGIETVSATSMVIERDDAYIAKLRAKEVEFWTKYVQPDIAPPERKLRLRMERNAL